MTRTPVSRDVHGYAAAGVAGLCIVVLAATRGDAPTALGAYLYVWLFFLGIALGSLVVLLVHELTGGAWGEALRLPLRAAAATLPLLAALFVPILLGLRVLYPWTHTASSANEAALLQAKHWYLNEPFFLLRAALYFAAWIGLAHWPLRRERSERLDAAAQSMRRASVIGLIVLSFTVTLAAVDWIMSLTPSFYSTVFGLLTLVGQACAGFAFALCSIGFAADRDRLSERVAQDLGNLLLMFVMTWAYLAYMQYLIVWIEDLPHDAGWYGVRAESGWRLVADFLFVAHLAIPLPLLLFRRVKRSPRALAAVAAMILVGRFADSLWQIAPAQRAQGLHWSWADPAAVIGIGSLWLAWWLYTVRSLPPSAAALAAEPEMMHG